MDKSGTGLGSDQAPSSEDSDESIDARDIILLGYYRNAEAMVRSIKETDPDLIDRILVIDFNLDDHTAIRAHGLKAVYGDISNPETLRHYCAGHVSVVVSTISDSFLRGVSNVELAETIRLINPGARFVATAVDMNDVTSLEHSGVQGIVCPPSEAAPAYGATIRALLDDPANS